MYTLREKSLMAFKWLTSFSRNEWELTDYPVRVRLNGEDVPADQQWLAQILNWPGPAGVGATKQAALAALAESLGKIRAYRRTTQEKMPRPGSKVPIQFASTKRVSSNPALHDDFIIRALGFSLDSPVFISDHSSLSDFGDERYVTELKRKIFEIYGVDVSDLNDALLCDIFDRIQSRD